MCEELKKRKALEAAGGRAYIAALSSEAPSTVNAGEYAKIVAEKAAMRRLIETAENIREKAYEESMEPSEILDFAEKGIFEIAQNRQTSDFSPIKEVLLENVAMIDRAIQTKGQVIGLSTGFKRLDELTSGLQKSDLVIIAARPAMGKTAFALNVAQNAAIKSGASVLIFSLEMSKAQLGQRLLAMESRVEMQKLKTGNIERNDWDRINMALDSLSRANIHIDDTPGVSVLEMKNKCRRLKSEKGLDLIVIDYLQLMKAEGRADSRQQEISTLSRYLKLLARKWTVLSSFYPSFPERRSRDKIIGPYCQTSENPDPSNRMRISSCFCTETITTTRKIQRSPVCARSTWPSTEADLRRPLI